MEGLIAPQPPIVSVDKLGGSESLGIRRWLVDPRFSLLPSWAVRFRA